MDDRQRRNYQALRICGVIAVGETPREDSATGLEYLNDNAEWHDDEVGLPITQLRPLTATLNAAKATRPRLRISWRSGSAQNMGGCLRRTLCKGLTI